MQYFSRAGHQQSSFYGAVPPPSGVSKRSLTSEDPTGVTMIARVEDLLLDSRLSSGLPLQNIVILVVPEENSHC